MIEMQVLLYPSRPAGNDGNAAKVNVRILRTRGFSN